MSKLIEVRANGLSEAEAHVSHLFASVGQEVEPLAVLVGLELAKAAIEIGAPVGGRVTRLLVAVNDTVHEGDLLLELEAAESVQPSAVLHGPSAVAVSSGAPQAKDDFHASP